MLTHLGSKETVYVFDKPTPSLLETFPNPRPERDYIIIHEANEFTSLCPKTGQPDFATLTMEFVPDVQCLESKSLKLYLMSYRNHGAFMEETINRIADDLADACAPKHCRVTGIFGVRGGITTTVVAERGSQCQTS